MESDLEKIIMQATTVLIDRVNSNKPWYRHRWPWLIMLGPFLVVLAASYSGWIAFTRQDAMVVDDYYKQGQAINQDLRRDAAAANLGLGFSARYDAAAGQLIGKLSSFGQPIPGKIRIHLIHPTQPEKDMQIEAQADLQGVFKVALPALDRARWQVLVENDQRDWRLMSTWMWPQQQFIEMKADLPPAD
jgi:hypothetical protein